MLNNFRFAHLPERLKETSRPFYVLASDIVVAHGSEDPGGQAGVALQKLLEAKDAAVRARLELDAKNQNRRDGGTNAGG